MPPRRSNRTRVLPLDTYLRQANDAQEKIEKQRVLISTNAGSAKAVAYLGPMSLRSRNSDANASLPPGIIAARRKYPRAYFKAGHMINACFGGNGQKSNNLTILTGSANTSMTAYDNRVKDALLQLRNLFRAFQTAKIPVGQIGTCRIRLEVKVSAIKWGNSAPDSYIANNVFLRARFDNYPEDRSDLILDTDHDEDYHLDEIKDRQDKIESLLEQASGTISNRNTGRYT